MKSGQALDCVCPNDTDCAPASAPQAVQGSAFHPQRVTLNLPPEVLMRFKSSLFKTPPRAALREKSGGKVKVSAHEEISNQTGIKCPWKPSTIIHRWQCCCSSSFLYWEVTCHLAHLPRLCFTVCYGDFQDTEGDLEAQILWRDHASIHFKRDFEDDGERVFSLCRKR